MMKVAPAAIFAFHFLKLMFLRLVGVECNSQNKIPGIFPAYVP